METLTQKAPTDKIKTTFNAEDTDEEDRTETFQTPNARVATDTQAENKKKNTLRKGFTRTTQDTLINITNPTRPKREIVKNWILRWLYCFYAIHRDRNIRIGFPFSINSIIKIWPLGDPI